MISISKLAVARSLLYKNVMLNMVCLSIHKQSNNFVFVKNKKHHKLMEMYQDKRRVAFVYAKLSRGQVYKKKKFNYDEMHGPFLKYRVCFFSSN